MDQYWSRTKKVYGGAYIHISNPKKDLLLDFSVSFENDFITIAINTAVVVHVKNLIIYSQTLRLSNICTYEEDVDKDALNMERGYSKEMIHSQMGKV